MSILYIPAILQALIMGIDEKFHHDRGLGKWERFGHPLDTLSVLFPLSYITLNDFTQSGLNLYICLSVFSCILITKDEFIHSKECTAIENWLHAVLFVLHPLIFLASGILWINDPQNLFLQYQPILIGAFFMYQVLRWSVPWNQLSK